MLKMAYHLNLLLPSIFLFTLVNGHSTSTEFESKTIESKTIESKTIESKTIESKIVESKIIQSDIDNSKSDQLESYESKSPEFAYEFENINSNEIGNIKLFSQASRSIHDILTSAGGEATLDMITMATGFHLSPYEVYYDTEWQNSYDYIIVGAGAAGATLAARLSEDSETTVLVLEAGGEETVLSNIPLMTLALSKTPMDWVYSSTSQKRCAWGVNKNQIPVAKGKAIGGSSSINGMLYVRGNPRDYDRWAEMTGGGHWSWADVFPYFIMSEGSRAKNQEANYHGTQGPLTVEAVKFPYPVDTAFVRGAQEIGLDIGDYNGASQERFSLVWLTTRDKKRCSSGRAYLGPASSRENLHILLYARVTKIVIVHKRAMGVRFIKDNQNYFVHARKEVILSAGAVNTAQLLMLSGIGPEDHLISKGIKIVHHLPGVGSNLQDHPFTMMMFSANHNTSFVLEREVNMHSICEYFIKSAGKLTEGGPNVIGFYRTKYAPDERPDTEIISTFFSPGGAAPFPLLAPYIMPYHHQDGLIVTVANVRPRSRGTVRLASSDPYAQPLIDYNLFEDRRDVLAIVEACKLVLKISQTSAMQSIGTQFFTTPLSGCTHYHIASDEYLECLARTLTYTFWHESGTAKMGVSTDPMAVVDSELRVFGVSSLRVVDTSIMPEVTTGNTYVPTVMIGEMAADIIKGRRLFSQPLNQQDH